MEPISIKGRVESIFHQNTENEFAVFTLIDDETSKRFRVAGTSVAIYEGDTVTCHGKWSKYKGEEQFKATQVITSIPMDSGAVFAFLSSGRIKNVSKKRAEKLVASFGSETLDVIENEPDRVLSISGIGQKYLDNLRRGVIEERSYARILAILHKTGLPQSIISRIYKEYGSDSTSVIEKDPYKLREIVPSIGFQRADKAALYLGTAGDDANRLEQGVFEGYKSKCQRDGHTGVPENELVKESSRVLSKNAPEFNYHDIVKNSLEQLVSEGRFIRVDMGFESPVLFSDFFHRCEKTIADKLLSLSKIPSHISTHDINWSFDKGIVFDDSQSSALSVMKENPVCVLTGGPGTGKSTIMKSFLVSCLKSTRITGDQILLCAPTGKASKRLSESTGLDAQTIHRALGVPDQKGERFFYNGRNPFPYEVVVVDESSMLDCYLTSCFLDAIPSGAHLVLVGDEDQLPSVGPGKVFSNIIESYIPVARLEKPHRFEGGGSIDTMSHLIASRKVPDFNHKEDENNVWFIPENNGIKAIHDKILSLIPRVSDYYGVDPFSQVQVLTPVRKTPCGVFDLNNGIQGLLNPDSYGINCDSYGNRYQIRVGDKVMETVNRGADGPFNGDVGFVKSVSVKPKGLFLDIDGEAVPYHDSDCNDLLLSYAMTIHKSQGSEYPVVIIPMCMAHQFMLNWKLLYTAFTRAKKAVILVGDKKAFSAAVKKQADYHRVTGLKHMLLSSSSN